MWEEFRRSFCPQFKILDHSLYPFVQESIQGKISNSTPTKATLVKKRLLEASDGQIGSNVIAFDKNKQRKVFSENLEFGGETLWTHEKGNNDNLYQSKLFTMQTLEMSSKATCCFVRQISWQNLSRRS